MSKKLTHTEFLEKLYENNEAYRNGEFEVVGEYVGNKAKILVRDKYGDMTVKASHLISGHIPTIQTAVDKSQYFINKAEEVHGKDTYNYSLIEYIDAKTKIKIICPIHNLYEQTPTGHIDRKNGCPKCSYISTGEKNTSSLEEFINKARTIHGDAYDYSLVEYINNHTKVNIICKEHNSFSQTPRDHLAKCGCKKCGLLKRAKTRTLSSEEFKRKAIAIHGETYNYDLVNYVSSHEKIEIICPIHNSFFQTPTNHLSNQGCPACRRQYNSYRKSDWIASAGNRQGIFYIIKCWDENEEFYKIGITHMGTRKRYAGTVAMPYTYEIIREIFSDNKEQIWDIEKEFIQKLKKYHYTPELPFPGSVYECFSYIPKKLLQGKI